jgi:iron complex transport system permease protein
VSEADFPLTGDGRRALRTGATRLGLVGVLVALVLFAVGNGAVAIAPTQVAAILAGQIGVALPWAFEPQQEAVLLAVRLPRVLLGALVGAALAVAGAAMQGLFRNPLADPGLIGVSSGAALAAVGAIVLGTGSLAGPFTLPVAAFVGGLVTTLLVYRLSSAEGRTSVATMLLAGIAVNALAGAGTGLLTFVATDAQLRSITFWSLGSLGGATWNALAGVAPPLLAAMVLLPTLARPLNAFLLGEAEAGHLGIDSERVKAAAIVLTALAVGAAVSVSGIIGFVGLAVPHLLRLLSGPDHRHLLIDASLLGASLLIGADWLCRTVVAPAELPIGILTAALGAPFFLWLLLRDRSQGWG